jgi:hypothetical protein
MNPQKQMVVAPESAVKTGEEGINNAHESHWALKVIAYCLVPYFVASQVVGWYSALMLFGGTENPCGQAGYFPQCLDVAYFACSTNLTSNSTCVASPGLPTSASQVIAPTSLGAAQMAQLMCQQAISFTEPTTAECNYNAAANLSNSNGQAYVLTTFYPLPLPQIVGLEAICNFTSSTSLTDPNTTQSAAIENVMTQCYTNQVGVHATVALVSLVVAVTLLVISETYVACFTKYHSSWTPWRAEGKKLKKLFALSFTTSGLKIVASSLILLRPNGLVLTSDQEASFGLNILFALGDLAWPFLNLCKPRWLRGL